MEPSKLIRPGDLWAVFVGVNEYDDPEWSSLPYCDKDAAALASLFMDPMRGGYTASNIRLLRDSAQKRFLKPTRSNILAAIKHLAEVADREDTIVFGFFGHGVKVDGVSYLFPSDGLKSSPQDTAIELKWVQDTLQNSKAQVKVLVFDACHSGALRARAGTGRMSRAFAHMLFEEFVQSEGWAVLSACKQDELSHDYDEKQHGVFLTCYKVFPTPSNHRGMLKGRPHNQTALPDRFARYARPRWLKHAIGLFGDVPIAPHSSLYQEQLQEIQARQKSW